MLKAKVVEYFGTQKNVSEKLGVTPVAVSRWGKVIPEKQALKLSVMTRGQLKYDASLY